ncbi:methyltransferase domain-containing protein [Nakamurella flavida]|uniref:Methyltransferase domain-containing protein n=1 Tax=Nakamurella flavida TaxID=363630 RepID=A0A938YEN0_9ACTN|nr:methyltransferase domain-containing protein [Nakamurella flavida]
MLACVSGHRFDVARQGYVALLGPGARTDTGDSADMVAARVDLLGSGAYAPIVDAVVQAVRGSTGDGGAVVELGAGTGYYLGACVGAVPGSTGLAIDSSRYASRRAAAVHRRVGAVLADAWSALPVRDSCADVVLSVFAPRTPSEIHRILTPGGRLVCVTPRPGHLAELRDVVPLLAVDAGKQDALVGAFAGLLEPVGSTQVEYRMELTGPQVGALIRMGPTARHLDVATVAATSRAARAVTVSVTCTVLQRPTR